MDVPLPPGSDGESDHDDVPSVSELPSLPENAESEAESDAAGVESDSGPARQVAQRPSKRCRPTNAGQPLPAPPAPIRLPVYVDAVMEIFSPPRLAPVAKQYGLAAQYSFDKPEWDADDEICRRYLRAILDKQKPYMLVLSPECRMHSILQRDCNLAKMHLGTESLYWSSHQVRLAGSCLQCNVSCRRCPMQELFLSLSAALVSRIPRAVPCASPPSS